MQINRETLIERLQTLPAFGYGYVKLQDVLNTVNSMEDGNLKGKWLWRSSFGHDGVRRAEAYCSLCLRSAGRHYKIACPNCGRQMEKPSEGYFEYCKRVGIKREERE